MTRHVRPASVLRGHSILIVDDEPALCEVLARALLRTGAIVSSVHSAQAAIESLSRSGFDLVLLDKRLGDKDGVALIGPLLEQRPGIAIVIMTGFASVEDSLAALEAGAVGYLLKPFHSLDEVVGELEEVVLREERRRRASVPPPVTATTTQSLGRRAQAPEAAKGPTGAVALLALPRETERVRLQLALEHRGLAVEHLVGQTPLAEALTRRAYDVIVVDGELSGGDGISALEGARSMSRRAALVLVGTTPSLEVTTRLLRLGQALFLRRPIEADVARKIERLLARHREGVPG